MKVKTKTYYSVEEARLHRAGVLQDYKVEGSPSTSASTSRLAQLAHPVSGLEHGLLLHLGGECQEVRHLWHGPAVKTGASQFADPSQRGGLSSPSNPKGQWKKRRSRTEHALAFLLGGIHRLDQSMDICERFEWSHKSVMREVPA